MVLRAGNAAVSYIQYLLKFIWPVNLAVYYPFPEVLPVWMPVCAGLILATMTLATLRLSTKAPYLTVGWLWYLGTLVPVIGILQAGLWPAMADRWAYIPLIGIYIIIAWGSVDLISRLRIQRPVLVSLVAAVLCFFTVTSWLQVRHWRNSTTLFRHALTVTGPNPVALNNLGNTFLGQGQTQEAIARFTTAIELNPRHARALNNLGVALAKNGDSKAAVAYYRKALQVIPAYAEAHNNLGAALRSQGKYAAAIAQYTKALQIKPRYDAAHYNLGLTYLHTGRISLAARHFRKALVLNQHNIAAKGGLRTATKIMQEFDTQMPSQEMTDSITSPEPNHYGSQDS
jgi:Tfp pilus assembly protein PilF